MGQGYPVLNVDDQLHADGRTVPITVNHNVWAANAARYPSPMAPAVATPAPEIQIFDGNNNTCTICVEAFVAGERVCRLLCRHVFHAICWQRNSLNVVDPVCANCRGLGQMIAIWDYIDVSLVTQAGVANHLRELRWPIIGRN